MGLTLFIQSLVLPATKTLTSLFQNSRTSLIQASLSVTEDAGFLGAWKVRVLLTHWCVG